MKGQSLGFEELDDDQLVSWINGWIAKVSGSVPIRCEGAVEDVGTISVSVEGDLQRLQLGDSVAGLPAPELSRAIEQGYVQAYREALRQVGLVFDRIEGDVADNAVLTERLRLIRDEYGDRGGLRRMLERQQADAQDSAWDPARDPLRRRL